MSPSSLRQACAAGSLASVGMLLESGVDVHSEDGEGGPALHVAACHQRSRVVQFLIDYGADVGFESAKYGSPLLAVLEGCTAPKLRSWAGAEPAMSLAKALPLPAPLLYFGTRSSGLGYKDFAECERVVRTLVDHGADVNTNPGRFGNALHLASFMGSEIIVRLLLDKGADVNATGGYFQTALLAAVEGYHPAIAELLLSRGINSNYSLSDNGTVLQNACLKQSKALVRTLLKYGADVNASGGQHGSPLAAAITGDNVTIVSQAGSHAIVELLFQYGDRIQIRECDLFAAAGKHPYSSQQSYIKYFLEYDKTLLATAPVIITAAKNRSTLGGETLRLLLKRDGGLGVTEAMLKAATKSEIMKVLLKHRPVCQITTDILVAAAQKLREAQKLMQLLFEHEPDIPITEAVILAMLEWRNMPSSSENLLELLFERNKELEVTEAMLKAAKSSNDMQVLLKHAPDMRVTQDVLVASSNKDPKLVILLLKHDKTVKIPPVLLRCYQVLGSPGISYMTTLLEHDPSIYIAPEVISAIASGYLADEDKQRFVELLLRYEKKIEFNEEVRTAIDQKFFGSRYNHLMALFYKLESKDTRALAE